MGTLKKFSESGKKKLNHFTQRWRVVRGMECALIVDFAKHFWMDLVGALKQTLFESNNSIYSGLISYNNRKNNIKNTIDSCEKWIMWTSTTIFFDF